MKLFNNGLFLGFLASFLNPHHWLVAIGLLVCLAYRAFTLKFVQLKIIPLFQTQPIQFALQKRGATGIEHIRLVQTPTAHHRDKGLNLLANKHRRVGVSLPQDASKGHLHRVVRHRLFDSSHRIFALEFFVQLVGRNLDQNRLAVRTNARIR